MSKKKWLLSIAIVATVLAVVLAIWPPTQRSFSGRLSLTSEEYKEFKTVVTNPDVNFNKVIIFNSDPYIIDFNIFTNNANFPYGKEDIFYKYCLPISIMFIPIAISLVWLFDRKSLESEK